MNADDSPRYAALESDRYGVRHWAVYDADTGQYVSGWNTRTEARACAAYHNLPEAPAGVLTVQCPPEARQHLHDAGAAYAGPDGPLAWQMDEVTLAAWCVRVTPEEAEEAIAGIEHILEAELVEGDTAEAYTMFAENLTTALRQAR